MNREQLVRWCAMREKAMSALAEANRAINDMATLSLAREPVLLHLADAGEALSAVKQKLTVAKTIATQEAA